MYSVYTLVDPRDYSIHYVGISVNPEERHRYHITQLYGNYDKVLWVKALQQYNLLPILKIIEACEERNTALQRESYWIEFYLGMGEPLANCCFPARKGKITSVSHGYRRYSSMYAKSAWEDDLNKALRRQARRLQS